MHIHVSGSSFCLDLSVTFDGEPTKHGLLDKRSTDWSLLHLDSNNREWVGTRRISHLEAIKRALAFLERECAKDSLAAHEAARAVAALRRNQ